MKNISRRKLLRTGARAGIYATSGLIGAEVARQLVNNPLKDAAVYMTRTAKSAESAHASLVTLRKAMPFYIGCNDGGAYEIAVQADSNTARNYRLYSHPENRVEVVKNAISDSSRQGQELMRQIFDEGLVRLITGSETRTAKDLQNLRSRIMAWSKEKIDRIAGKTKEEAKESKEFRLMDEYAGRYNELTHTLADYIVTLKDEERQVRDSALEIHRERLETGEVDNQKVEELLRLQRDYVRQSKEKIGVDKLPIRSIAFGDAKYTFAVEQAQPVIEQQRDRYGLIKQVGKVIPYIKGAGALIGVLVADKVLNLRNRRKI